MIRIFFTYVLPLLMPSILYFVWMSWVRRKVNAAIARGEDAKHVELKTPWLRLLLAGIILMAVGLGVVAVLGGGAPAGSQYQPPRYVDGKIAPAEMLPAQK